MRPEVTRGLALGGLGAVALSAVLVGLLHVIPPSARLNPVRRTISEYALLETGWLFNLAVLALAGGSMAVLLALVGARVLTVLSAGAVALLMWSLSLAAVVVFPKHNWAVGPSMDGDIHRMASLLAFLSLPAAALTIGLTARRQPQWRAHGARSAWLGLASLLCFSPIALAIALQPVTGVRWWRAIPLGATERALVVTEVVAVAALGWLALRAADHAARSADTGPAGPPGGTGADYVPAARSSGTSPRR